jgi:hypothetical protein
MDSSPGEGGNPEPVQDDRSASKVTNSNAAYLAKISTMRSGPAYADQYFGGDREKGTSRASYSADSVVLTLEFLSDSGAKFLILLLRLSMLVSFTLLILQLWWKLSNDKTTLAYNDTIIVVNLVVAVLGMSLLLVAGGFYLFGIYKAIREKKRWNSRRKRYCILGGFNLLFEFLISVSFSVD